jgi:SAM-dependent methyltransferase
LSKLVRGRTLDVGCGHGEYTNRWAEYADEVVGYDMTEGFLATANRSYRKPNVRYVLGRTHDGLPFEDGYFDFAYTKKGPTSWYPEAGRILRPGADLLALHPGDGNGEGGELGICFPGLFGPPEPGTPILDRIYQRMAAGGLIVQDIQVLRETTYLPSPEDILALVCFGQSEDFSQWANAQLYDSIRRQFERHRAERGIRSTGFYYLVRAKTPDNPEADSR